ncbi:MAG TPA: pitrilysin family protein [Dehalococcoidia bacterium]|nr:pitrilysin family protein [Dehalococcoidia bacterium]
MFQKTTFPNGLRVLTSCMPHTRSVSVSLYLGAGSRYEAPEVAGISHFVEHLLFKGTTKRPRPEDVSGAIENLGGLHNGATDREITSYWCKVARPHFLVGLDVLLDMVHHSKFDPEEVEKERKVIIEEISMVQDSPPELAGLLIDQTMWPDQPLGRDVGGTKETVNGITRSMLVEYLNHQYGPGNAVISIAGDLEHAEAIEALEPSLDEWRPSQPGSLYPTVESQTGPRVSVINRKTEQAHLCLALPGLSTLHPDRYVLALLNTVLGEGSTSRLFLEVRERRGLAYDIHSYVSHFLDAGALTVYAGVDPKNASDTLRVVLDQLLHLRTGIPEEELSRARELIKGRMLLRMEDTRAVSSWIGSQELLTGTVKTVDEVVEQIDAITAEEVQRVACTLIKPERLNLAVVGPFRSDRPFYRLLQG